MDGSPLEEPACCTPLWVTPLGRFPTRVHILGTTLGDSTFGTLLVGPPRRTPLGEPHLAPAWGTPMGHHTCWPTSGTTLDRTYLGDALWVTQLGDPPLADPLGDPLVETLVGTAL